MTWTVDEVVSWGTCYPEARVRELLSDPVTPEQVAGLDIPAVDRCCLLLRSEVLGARRQLRLALDMASTLLDAGADPELLHAMLTDDTMRPDDVPPLTWSLVCVSAQLARQDVIPFEAQLPVLLEYHYHARD